MAKGERLARMIEAGVAAVNDAQINYVALELPMGGWKASGLGSRHGADGIRKYTKKQAIMVTRFALKKDIHMLPYKASTRSLIGRDAEARVRPRQARLAQGCSSPPRRLCRRKTA